MNFEYLTNDQLARIFTAGILVLLGLWQIVDPGCFWGISMYFRGARRALPPPQRERLARVLAERECAEGVTDHRSRYVGGFTIAMALLTLVPALPFVLPYALVCLGIAWATLMSYLRFRRATERRVAPLVPRNPWTSLSPIAIAGTAICLTGAALFAAYPQYRAGVIVVIVSAVALLVIAWRVAVAPAILFGNDSQLEYVVDEHLRFARATNLLALACAPPTVLVFLAVAALPRTAHFFGVVTLVVAIAFLTVTLMSLNPIRKRITIA